MHRRLKIKDAQFSSKAHGTHEYKDIQIDGRVQLDVMTAIQRDHKLSSYSLNSVSYHFLKVISLEPDLGSSAYLEPRAEWCTAWLPALPALPACLGVWQSMHTLARHLCHVLPQDAFLPQSAGLLHWPGWQAATHSKWLKAQACLQEQKEDVHHSKITDLQNGTDESRRRLAVYCLKVRLFRLQPEPCWKTCATPLP